MEDKEKWKNEIPKLQKAIKDEPKGEVRIFFQDLIDNRKSWIKDIEEKKKRDDDEY